MKRLAICMTALAICALCGSVEAQSVPPKVCQAIDECVAAVDAIKAVADAKAREKRYEDALATFETVVKGGVWNKLCADFKTYAALTESVVTADGADPKLPELLDKRLKLRGMLLTICGQ